MVLYKLFSLFIHFKLLMFLTLVVSSSIPKLMFSVYLVILVQKVFMFKAQNFLSIRI